MAAVPSTPTKPGLPGEERLPRGGRVLVVRLSALRAERPDVAVDFLVEERFAALLRDNPQIDRVLFYPRRRWLRIPGAIRALRQRRYDVVLDVHGIQKSAFQVWLARASTKVGPAAPGSREGAAFAYRTAVAMPTPLPHRADIGHRLLASIGLSGRPVPPVLPVQPAPPTFFDGLVGPRVFLHPGTSAFAAFKRWPADRFAELARRLRARGIAVLVGFGPGEEELAKPILTAAPGSRAVDGGALGLLGLAGVMQQCDVVVAADTGPLHLGAAVGARCVALFGPKNEARYGPRAHGDVTHEILFHDVPCRPCTRRTCVTPLCVLGIDVATVEAAVLRQLAAKAPR